MTVRAGPKPSLGFRCLRRGARVGLWTGLVAGACLALLVEAGTAGPLARAAAARARTRPARIVWRNCGVRLQCARLRVPLDWRRPNRKQIELAVIQHLASRPNARIGSMFINPGGPGESGVELVRNAGAELDAWGAGRFNVVSWDPRGTNASDPVRCFTSQASEKRFWRGVQIPTTATQSRAYERKAIDLAHRCGRVSGKLLAHISTADSARDLDYLRRLVGDRRLTYVGISYGSFLGQTYANMFPGRVRAMMLDSIVDQKAWVQSAEARNAATVAPTAEVFKQFLALCQRAGRARCALAGHPETAARRVARLFRRARRAPIPAPHADPAGQLSYSDLLLTTLSPLRTPEAWPRYAQELDAAANGDASALEDAARTVRTPGAFSKATTSAAIQCLDGPARGPVSAWRKVIRHLTKLSELSGPFQGWTQWAPCAANWPARSTDRYTGPWNRRTKNPILLINNLYDPSTGYRGAQRAERLLGNAVLLTNAGYGHPSYADPSRCIEHWRVRYLVHLITPPLGTVCQPDRQPFDSDFGKPLPRGPRRSQSRYGGSINRESRSGRRPTAPSASRRDARRKR
jgi:pimeloyl-ACP methyl ester carboxylesterase